MALNYICNNQLATFNFWIRVDSKSVLYALKNWDCKMRGDILYEVKYLIHCIISSFAGYRLIVVFNGMKLNISKFARQAAMKNMSETSYSNLLLLSHEIISILEKNVCKQLKKVNLQYLLVRGI